jgi:hypothetical protein
MDDLSKSLLSETSIVVRQVAGDTVRTYPPGTDPA